MIARGLLLIVGLPLIAYGAIAGMYEVAAAGAVLLGAGFALDDAEGEIPRRATRTDSDLAGDAALARLRDLYAVDAITPLQLEQSTGFVLAGGTITPAGQPRFIPVPIKAARPTWADGRRTYTPGGCDERRLGGWDERQLPPMW